LVPENGGQELGAENLGAEKLGAEKLGTGEPAMPLSATGNYSRNIGPKIRARNIGEETMNRTLSSWSPNTLSLLRIVVGVLFLQHGLVKLFAFPMPFPNPPAFGTLIWYQGWIEIIGGALIILGLLTRLTAFILAGDMAFAYFMGHAGRSFYPIQNGGNLSILYSFVFFYLVFAGPGPWSVDAKISQNA
jgi:putative oxidoreductase